MYYWGAKGNPNIPSEDNDDYQTIPVKVMDNVREAKVFYHTFAAITTDDGLYFYKSNDPFFESSDIPDIKKVELPEGMTIVEACEKVLSEIVDTQNYYMKEYRL